jgi:hypothetical protein
MLNLINYIVNSLQLLHSSIVVISVLCLSLSIPFYCYKYPKVSFFLLYMSLTCCYSFIILTQDISVIWATYFYYFSIFLSYHFYFNLSKRSYCRTIIVIKKYLNASEYFKFILWIVFVLIPALLGETFIFLVVFNSLFVFSLVTANFKLFFFLFIEWIWIFILLYSNLFNIFNNFLSVVQNYFSRKACLHFIGNTIGSKLPSSLGPLVMLSPLVAFVPAAAGLAVEKESQTGNYAINKMHEFQSKHPGSTHNEQYKVYRSTYESHGNSSLVGRGLTSAGFMKPASPTVVIPEYKSELSKSFDALNKK